MDGAENRIVTLILEDAQAEPLGNEPVRLGDRIVGKTTSAAFGHRVGAPVALADIFDPAARADGATVTVDIARTLYSATVWNGPAFDPEGTRMRTSARSRDA